VATFGGDASLHKSVRIRLNIPRPPLSLVAQAVTSSQRGPALLEFALASSLSVYLRYFGDAMQCELPTGRSVEQPKSLFCRVETQFFTKSRAGKVRQKVGNLISVF
jgi:hypothetical protein